MTHQLLLFGWFLFISYAFHYPMNYLMMVASNFFVGLLLVSFQSNVMVSCFAPSLLTGMITKSTKSSAMALFVSSSSSTPHGKSKAQVGSNHQQGNNNDGSSSSTSISSSRVKPKKKKKKTLKKGNKVRHSQKELQDLVRNIGLKPVTTTTSKSTDSESSSSSKMLDSTKELSTKVQLQYARNGHAAICSSIPIATLQSIKRELINFSKSKELEAWKQKVEVATKSTDTANSCISISQCKSILKQYNENGDNEMQIPFLQHFNTWQSKTCPTVKSLAISPLLSNMAAQLLDVPFVRLYQDSLFHKRCGDGPTPWHSDARMTPFDTSNMITFWIPLDDVASIEEGGTGLLFVDKSHVDFALPFWNPVPKCDEEVEEEVGNNNDNVYNRLEERYGGDDSVQHHMPLVLGDCTVHAGWTLHCAEGIPSLDEEDTEMGCKQQDRYALAVSFVDARAEIRHGVKNDTNSLGHDEDRQSFQEWIQEIEPRQYFEHPLVPIVWPKN